MNTRHRWLRLSFLLAAALAAALATRAIFGPVMVWREVNVGVAPGADATAIRWEHRRGGAQGGAWLGDDASDSEWIDLPAIPLRWISFDGRFSETTRPPTVLTGFLGVSWTTTLGPATLRDASIRWDLGSDLAILAWDLAGLAALWLALLALGVIARRSRGEEPYRAPRRRRHWPVWAALGLVAGVNAAIATRLPVMYPPDAVEYAANAITLHRTGSFEHFGSWRLPGFSVVLLPLVARFDDFGAATGRLNALLLTATAAGCGLALRRFVPPWFAAAAVLLVGLHPLLLLYQRQAMPEVLAAALVTLVGVALLRTTPKTVPRAAWTFSLLGVLLGLSVYLRANFQILVLWLPVAGAVGAYSAGRRRVAVAMLGAAWLAGACTIAPWIVRNARRTGVPSMAVGSGYTRAISARETGWLDANQSDLLTREEWSALHAAPGATAGPFQFLDAIRSAWGIPGGEEGRVAFDARCDALARESAARHAGRRWTQAVRAFASVSGLYPFADPGYRENEYWSRPLAGEAGLTRVGNHWTAAAGFRELSPARAGEVIARTAHPPPADRASRAFGAWFALAAPWQIALAWVSLLGVWGAWRDARRTASLLFAAPIIHAGVLAAFAWTGIDRYAVPLIPVQAIAAIYGLWWGVRAIRSRTHATPAEH